MINSCTSGYKRIHHGWIPRYPCLCDRSGCVYCDQGCCLDPQNNHGNSDALCFHENHRQLLNRLTRATPTECAPAQARVAEDKKNFWKRYEERHGPPRNLPRKTH